MAVPSKPCRSCGRRVTWRKKWERDWEQVLYCSRACRTRGLSGADLQLEERLRTMLRGLSRGVLDEEVARAVDPARGASSSSRCGGPLGGWWRRGRPSSSSTDGSSTGPARPAR